MFRTLDEREQAFVELTNACEHTHLFEYRLKKCHHINILEDIVYTTSIKHLSSDLENWEKRFIVGTDSKTTTEARCRGRPSSFRMNGTQRASLPFLVVPADLCLHFYFVHSELNAADDETRDTRTRSAGPMTERVKKAWHNKGPLMPEHSLDGRFVRGLPRGSACQNLTIASGNTNESKGFLDSEYRKAPT